MDERQELKDIANVVLAEGRNKFEAGIFRVEREIEYLDPEQALAYFGFINTFREAICGRPNEDVLAVTEEELIAYADEHLRSLVTEHSELIAYNALMQMCGQLVAIRAAGLSCSAGKYQLDTFLGSDEAWCYDSALKLKKFVEADFEVSGIISPDIDRILTFYS